MYLELIITMINKYIEEMNKNNVKIYDIDNPEFYIKEVKYDKEADQIFFYCEEDEKLNE